VRYHDTPPGNLSPQINFIIWYIDDVRWRAGRPGRVSERGVFRTECEVFHRNPAYMDTSNSGRVMGWVCADKML